MFLSDKANISGLAKKATITRTTGKRQEKSNIPPTLPVDAYFVTRYLSTRFDNDQKKAAKIPNVRLKIIYLHKKERDERQDKPPEKIFL